jgi:aspartyl-tRNA(Asn)/glutamyl-tRNA(Gln) amidotransferase subunit A
MTTTPWVPRQTRPAATTVEQALQLGWLVTHAPPGDVLPATGPLTGLTVAVKDIIDVAGLPVRNGTPGALWRHPQGSAPAWERLAVAGARCIGKAATHEMAWGVTTPQIPHPTRSDRVAGGSSGGSAACVAGDVSQAGLGTDTGGSLRIPAALCGIVGFRPTTGSVDMDRITPLAPAQDVAGPMADNVRTCTAMLEVLLGRGLGTHADGIHGLRLGVCKEPGPLDDLTKTAYHRVLASLERGGVEVIACETPLLRQSSSLSLLTMLLSSAAIHGPAVRANPTGFGPEARALLTIGDDLIEHEDLLRRARAAITNATARLFASVGLDAFVTPTTACTAPLKGARTVWIADRDVPVSAALTRFTAWASTTAMPAISVPAPGTSALPVGIQIMAPPGREDICVRLALFVEE